VTDYQHLEMRLDGAVAVIVLQRPASLNAFTLPLARELLGALRELNGGHAGIRSVVLTGAGRAFSAGADIKQIDGDRPLVASGRPDLGWALREVYNPLILAIRQMPQPVVSAVNGVAAGIGASIALASDFVLAARSASLMLAFVKVGLVPDGGSSLLVSARAGVGRAAEMAMLGEPIDAERALRWNLVSSVEEDDRLLPAALELAARLAAGPPEALAAIKALLNRPWLDLLRRQLVLEAEAQTGRSESTEVLEAMAAFREKRTPLFEPAKTGLTTTPPNAG
jgi:2-(1,2-epoxy-1,2-dihydrophenyl)acetyl-CoA isomerase